MDKKKKLTMVLFWILSFTWALPTTILGAIVALGLRCAGNKPTRFGPCWCFEMDVNFGLDLGLFFIAPKSKCYSLKCHELGHHLQACFLFGPLTLFVCSIPSAIRFWLRNMKTFKAKTVYCVVLTVLVFALGVVASVVGAAVSVWFVQEIGIAIRFYALAIGYWLLWLELPQYKEKPYPRYEDFKVEFDASARGAEFMQKYFPEYTSDLC